MGLHGVDITVMLIYLIGVVAFGCWFARKNKTVDDFTAAGRSLPGWAVGLSIFGTYLSSNTFIGVPGKAFGGNWNAFVFSLSLPIAAWIGAKVFIPFYRESGEISAYHHLEKRFGRWARVYADVCYLLAQIGRMGAVMFGVAIGLHALLDWNMSTIIIVSGILVTLYTLLGGIAAVIWTDVVQSIILIGGALLILGLVMFGMPEGPTQVFSVASAASEGNKFSLGSFIPNLTISSFWVVLLFGVFSNLGNFGVDQSFVQRYHTAKSDREARKSLWFGALLYIPISAVFFLIGSALFAHYSTDAEMMASLKNKAAISIVDNELAKKDSTTELTKAAKNLMVETKAATLTTKDVADKALPHYIANKLKGGLAGLLLAAIFAAAMSSIDTSLNSSSTIILTDIYKPFFNPKADNKESMKVLRISTIAAGLIGTVVSLSMIGAKSLLGAWWKIHGIFSGALLGLFLLGLIAKKAKSVAAITGVVIGVIIIGWLTFSPMLTENLAWMKNPLHDNMTVVVGTLSIFLVGVLTQKFLDRNNETADKPKDEGANTEQSPE